MADPIKDNATSSENESGVPSGAPASSKENAAADTKTGAEGTATDDAGETVDGDSAEDLLDATLEAEAAAIIDEALDNDRAQADLEAAKKEVADWKDKYMRLHADWDTYRRRQKEQAEQQKALAAEKLVTSLLPVIDDLERTIDYAEKNGEGDLLDGVKAVMAKFVDTLNKDGVDVINPVGEAFEALEAQAVGTVDDASQPNETVAEVYQKGYKIGTKVLRPAMVTVTVGGPDRPKEDKETDE